MEAKVLVTRPRRRSMSGFSQVRASHALDALGVSGFWGLSVCIHRFYDAQQPVPERIEGPILLQGDHLASGVEPCL